MSEDAFNGKRAERPLTLTTSTLIGGLCLVVGLSQLGLCAMPQTLSPIGAELSPASGTATPTGASGPLTRTTSTGVTRDDYLNLAETVFGNLLSDHFDCESGIWTSKPYPQDPDLPSELADGSAAFVMAAAYMAATGETTLQGCELPTTMWRVFENIDAYLPPQHYQTGITCAKLVSAMELLGGPIEDNPFWASLGETERSQFRQWVITNKDWEPAANNMYLFRAMTRYHLYAWGWTDTLAESTADQETFLDFVTDEGWLYDGPHGINDYCIYSVFGAFLNERLNLARISYGDPPIRLEQSTSYSEAMVRYFIFAAGEDREPMPWSRSNGLYGLGVWIGMPELMIAQGRGSGIEAGMYKRASHLYYQWLEDFWYDGRYFNPYLDPTGVESYENAFNGNGQVVATLLESYIVAAQTDEIDEIPIPAERMSYDLTYRFGHPPDPTYGVRVVNDLTGALGGSRIEKPAFSSDFVPPTVQITTPVSGTRQSSPLEIGWVGDDAQFYMLYSDGDLRTLTTTVTVSLQLSPGSHLVRVKGVDQAWNTVSDQVGVQISADVNNDGIVDLADIQLVADHWRCACDAGDCYEALYDLNGDCHIDVLDIMLVATHWGETGADSTQGVERATESVIGTGAPFHVLHSDGERRTVPMAMTASLHLTPGPHLVQVKGVDQAWNMASDQIRVQIIDTPALLYLPLILRANG